MNEAWQHAKEIAGLLPRGTVWSFCITDIEDDAVFNIYAPTDQWYKLRLILSLGRAEFRFDDTRLEGQSFEEHIIDGLTLSFITPEVTDEPNG